MRSCSTITHFHYVSFNTGLAYLLSTSVLIIALIFHQLQMVQSQMMQQLQHPQQQQQRPSLPAAARRARARRVLQASLTLAATMTRTLTLLLQQQTATRTMTSLRVLQASPRAGKPRASLQESLQESQRLTC
jgi:hypothetical protein